MTARIHKLSALLINQISAGEVVTRPASVVKELIENAIDANATHIVIHIEQGGIGLIQVSDNGSGIHPDDMLLAVTRHATSKLADVGQLIGINSLGFRGEALASIGAVSHLTLISSHNHSGIGQQLTLSGDAVEQANLQAVVKSQGTTVIVRDLYFNVPARRANLKSIATEFNHIEQIVQRIAISFANIHIELYHQNKLRFNLASQSTSFSLSRLEQLYALSLRTIAQEFSLSLQNLQSNLDEIPAKIIGWLFLDHQEKKPNLPKLIYINQRLVTDLTISQAIQKTARQVGIDHLSYALFFELPTEWVNVNVHPSKQQVKIQPLTNILVLLNQALLEKLKKSKQIVKKKSQVEELRQPYQTPITQASTKNQSNCKVILNKNIIKNKETNLVLPKPFELPIVLQIVQQDDNLMMYVHWKKILYLIPLTKMMQNYSITKINQWLNENLTSLEKIENWLQQCIASIEYQKLTDFMKKSNKNNG